MQVFYKKKNSLKNTDIVLGGRITDVKDVVFNLRQAYSNFRSSGGSQEHKHQQCSTRRAHKMSSKGLQALPWHVH